MIDLLEMGGRIAPFDGLGTPLCTVWAYLDPGAGSLFLQMMIAGLLSGMYFANSALRFVMTSVFKK
jgi:hypothetical protein